MWNADIGRYQEHAGLPGIISCQNKALETPLIAEPGTRWEYGINIDFAGKLVEKLSGQKLDAYLQDHVFAPLGMTETGLKIRPDQRARLARMHARMPDGSLSPIDFEIPQDPEFHMGGGGLYSVGDGVSRVLPDDLVQGQPQRQAGAQTRNGRHDVPKSHGRSSSDQIGFGRRSGDQ